MKSRDQILLEEAYKSIYTNFLVEGAKDMITSSLKKLQAPDNIIQFFLKKEDNKPIFKPEHVGTLYNWIKNEHGNINELEQDYKDYQKFFQNTPLNQFKSYINWTEKVHSKRDEAKYQNRNKDLKDIDEIGRAHV